WHTWAEVAGTGAFTARAFVCLFAGLRRLGSVRTSIVAASEPLAATVLAVTFLHEPLRAGTVAGGTIILAGAVAASRARGGATAGDTRAATVLAVTLRPDARRAWTGAGGTPSRAGAVAAARARGGATADPPAPCTAPLPAPPARGVRAPPRPFPPSAGGMRG